MKKPDIEAIILIGHGSRVKNASRAMDRVARGLKKKFRCRIVEVCHMSMIPPTLSEAFEKCARQGAKRLIIIPYFLHAGAHILEDIPKMIRQEAAKHPDIQVRFGAPLGFDPCLVDLVWKRITEARGRKPSKA